MIKSAGVAAASAAILVAGFVSSVAANQPVAKDRISMVFDVAQAAPTRPRRGDVGHGAVTLRPAVEAETAPEKAVAAPPPRKVRVIMASPYGH